MLKKSWNHYKPSILWMFGGWFACCKVLGRCYHEFKHRSHNVISRGGFFFFFIPYAWEGSNAYK
jgi:hypothetical protein